MEASVSAIHVGLALYAATIISAVCGVGSLLMMASLGFKISPQNFSFNFSNLTLPPDRRDPLLLRRRVPLL
jgi:hypothetical protein